MTAIAQMLLVATLIMIAPAWAEHGTDADGRWLPDGTWQARNTRATQPEPQNPSDNPFDIFTEWGTDIRLTDFGDSASAVNQETEASGSHVYVAWKYLYGNTIFIAQSDDAGANWINYRLSDDSTSNAMSPQIAASDSNVYVVYRAYRPYWGIYMRRSHDHGQTWQHSRVYYTARNLAEHPVAVSRDSLVFVLFPIEVNYVPPNQDWDLFLYKSYDYGISYSDTFYVSDTTSGGIGPDMAINCTEREPDPVLHLIREVGLVTSTQEIAYQRSIDGGETWMGPIVISDDDTIHSFWPQITAWGDSNVMASWSDYKYSDEAWTADAFVSKSADNGLNWSIPLPMTNSHGVTATDIFASEDTIILTYDDAAAGPAAIYANVSFDGGATWEGEQRVSDAYERCYEPSVAISQGVGHITWQDSRNDTVWGSREIYYDRSQLITTIHGDYSSPIKIDFGIDSYPNPFNSATILTVSNWKGGEAEIRICDIAGRLVKKLKGGAMKGGDIKAAWDATDTSGKKVSSGIYFARASGDGRTTTCIKLLYIK